jgi:hypothetical protein
LSAANIALMTRRSYEFRTGVHKRQIQLAQPSGLPITYPFSNCETHSDHLHEDFTMGVIMSANLAAPLAEK